MTFSTYSWYYNVSEKVSQGHFVIYLLIALILMTGYYAFVVIVLFIGTLRVQSSVKSNAQPFVSVIVATRNEEATIGECIHSLLNQDYPADKYEIIVVNDRSTDETGQIIEKVRKRSANVIRVDITSESVEMAGKQNALNAGIKKSRGSIILTTDADCMAKSSWIKTMVSYFDEKTGVVIGLPVTREDAFFAKLQSIDLVYLLNCAVGIIGWNKPISAIGNNMAVRAEAINQIGGISALGFTVTEDAALIRTVSQKTDWLIRAARDINAVVITKPVKNLRQFYKQRSRWIIGGFVDAPKWGIVAIQLILLFYILLFSLIPVAIFLRNTELLFGVGICFLVKLLVDFVLASDIFYRLKKLDFMKFFIPYEIFQMLYGILIWFSSIVYRRVNWKEQSY